MLNSSSNNPGNGNLDGLKAKLGAQNQAGPAQADAQEPIIQEVYEEEPDDYNFVQPLREVDEHELRNLSAIRESDSVDKRVYMACGAFLIAALIGGGIGFAIASNAAAKAEVQRKAAIARTIKNTVNDRLDGLKSLKQAFSSVADSNYNEAAFDSFRNNARTINFMLDMSSDVTAEAILLVEDTASNPLKAMRVYSAKSMLLRQLLETHNAETRAESDAISELQSHPDDASVVYAMQVIPEALNYLATDAPRSQYANGVLGIFTYRDVIEDDAAASTAYEQLKNENRWSEVQRQRRDYQPDAKEAKRLAAEGLTLPNHLIYDVVDRTGRNYKLFADEIILVDRALFFGAAANAKQRYDLRTQQIRALIDELSSVSGTIVGDLDKFIPDDKK